MIKYTDKDLAIWESTAKLLVGKDLRTFMASVVDRLGYGGQRFVEREFGWCRKTIQKGQREINGEILEGDLSARGRKKSEYLLPSLLTDIKAILDPISQADPSFRSDYLYSPITAKEVRRRLIVDKGYQPEQLPTDRTINTKMKDLDFKLKKNPES